MTKFNDNAGQIYWTGASVQHFSEDGTLHQSLLIDTVDHKKSDVSCADIGATSPCIGNGGVSVLINGVRHTTPAEFETTKGHQFAAANLPCKSMNPHLASHRHVCTGLTHRDGCAALSVVLRRMQAQDQDVHGGAPCRR
jgi:hypothetical protein